MVNQTLPLSPSFMAQKGTCTFRLVPNSSARDPVVVTCPTVSSQCPSTVVPGSLKVLQPHSNPDGTPHNSFNPSQEAELRVKPVTVSPSLRGPLGPQVLQTSSGDTAQPNAPQTCSGEPSDSHFSPEGYRAPKATQTFSEVSEGPLSPPESTHKPPLLPDPELASNPVELDIVCVDGDTIDVVDLEGCSSNTENSSDFDSDDDRETPRTNDEKVGVYNLPTVLGAPEGQRLFLLQREIHNVLERRRRGHMNQLFQGLRSKVGHNLTSKISTLTKVQLTHPNH